MIFGVKVPNRLFDFIWQYRVDPHDVPNNNIEKIHAISSKIAFNTDFMRPCTSFFPASIIHNFLTTNFTTIFRRGTSPELKIDWISVHQILGLPM